MDRKQCVWCSRVLNPENRRRGYCNSCRDRIESGEMVEMIEEWQETLRSSVLKSIRYMRIAIRYAVLGILASMLTVAMIIVGIFTGQDAYLWVAVFMVLVKVIFWILSIRAHRRAFLG